MRELSIPSLKGVVCSFVLFLTGAALFYFYPEIYFNLHKFEVNHADRYHFMGILILIIGSAILCLDISNYIKKRQKSK
jgi:hypothetical protein